MSNKVELTEAQAERLSAVTLPLTGYSVQKGVVNGIETIGIILELDGSEVVYPYSTRETMEKIAREILSNDNGGN